MWSFTNKSIATQLSLWFLLVALLPLGFVAYLTFRSSENSLTKEVTDKLIAIGQRQSNQIEKYLRERERSVSALSRSTAMGEVMEKLEKVFHAKGPYSAHYAAVEQTLWPFAVNYQEASGYEDLYLIALNGDVVFSSGRGKDFGVNLRRTPYRNSELSKVFERSLMSMTTELSDFAYYEPAERPVAFIAAPLFKGEFLVAVVAVRMNNEEVYRLVNDYTGLGETGEIVVAAKFDGDTVFVTPIRHDLNAAFKRKVRIGSKRSMEIQEAVQGKKGSGITTDYRGKEVLAIWRYLPYLRWGITVKIDTAEAFAPIAHLRILSSIIAAITLLLVVSAAVLLARSFSRPIVKLTEMTKSIAGGDLTQKIVIPVKNEIGLLAGSFNEMTRQLNESIENLKHTTAAKERIESELKIAHEIQMSMVPKTFPPFPHRREFNIYATLVPAREVGGDFYDFFFIDEQRLCFAIGDVSGKGIPASLFMALTKTLFRAIGGRQNATAEAILSRLNREICRDNESCMFVTVFCGVLDVRTGQMNYSNAGHNLPYVVSDGNLQVLRNTGGMALGVSEAAEFHAGQLSLKPGDQMVLYTDGVTEAMAEDEQFFAESRLETTLQAMRGQDSKAIIEGVVKDVQRFAAGAPQSDDITLLALDYKGIEKTHAPILSLVLKNDLTELQRLSQLVAKFGEHHGIVSETVHRVTLVLEEIITNIISYGYQDRLEHEISVCVSWDDPGLTLQVTDDGYPFNPLEVPPPDMDQALAERRIGGMGIHLVRELVDELEYCRENKKNILVLKTNIRET